MPDWAVLVLTFEKETFFRDGQRMLVRDLSGQDNHGIVHGCRPAPGRAGQGLQLAGASDYVDCGASQRLDPTDAVTVSVWIMGRRWKVTSHDRNDIVSHDSWARDHPLGYTLRCNLQAEPDFTVGNGAWTQASCGQAMQAGQWYHLVGRSGPKSVSIFVGGEEMTIAEASTPLRPSPSPLTIGRGAHDTGRRFDGVIDELAVFNRALSDDEIKVLFQLGLRGQTLAKPGRGRSRR
jgi:MSHA biogenesis protein MshQ